VRVWLDIDNPPQARYLLPLARRFENAGCDVLLTARSSENTLAILDSEGATYHEIGASFGKGVLRKVYGVAARRKLLIDFLVERGEKVDLVVTGSRSAALVARQLGFPSFVIIDYEHVNLVVYRLARSYVLHPHIIRNEVFERRGIPEPRLLPFQGLKEDLTFADSDIASVTPWSVSSRSESLPRVLVRPPAEESHYYRSESLRLLLALLRFLARQDVEVIYSPRYDRQVRYLRNIVDWRREPVVLREPVPVVALLKGVDAVVSAGGTMIREAAYLGIPAYSVFRGRPGAVDEYLDSIGRMFLLRSPQDLRSIHLRQRASVDPLRQDSETIDEVVRMILGCVSETGPAPMSALSL
jgi:predicted glycosyltransferase